MSVPSRLTLGKVSKGQKKEIYVYLFGLDMDTVKITSVKSDSTYIETEINNNGFQNRKNCRVKVTLNPGLKVGKFRSILTLYTDHPEVKELSLVLMGEIVADISISPKYVIFGAFKRGQPVQKIIKLRARPGKVFEIMGVSCSEPAVVMNIKTVKEGSEYNIKAVVGKDFNKKLLKGEIIIKTDNEKQKNIKLEIFGNMINFEKKEKDNLL